MCIAEENRNTPTTVWCYCLTSPSKIKKGQGTSASMTFAKGISKLYDNCVTVVGSDYGPNYTSSK